MSASPLTAQEAQHMQELVDILKTSSTPGWMRIMKRLEELVGESREQMLGAGDKPDVILTALARRWTQREAMLRDIKEYIASCQTEKDEILKSIDRSDPPNGEY